MSILKSNSDGEILRASGGDILNSPPIIDISSDYGVTKDASNLVSRVKNRYQPNVFRADIGEQPIENGDGLEFSSDRLYNNLDWHPDCDLGFTITVKCTLSVAQSSAIVCRWKAASVDDREWFLGKGNNSLQFYIYDSTINVNQFSTNRTGLGYNEITVIAKNIDGLFHVVIKGTDENGDFLYATSIAEIQTGINRANRITLGNADNSSYAFNGNIYSCKIWDNANGIEKYI